MKRQLSGILKRTGIVLAGTVVALATSVIAPRAPFAESALAACSAPTPVDQSRTVSVNPANWTPNVNGNVNEFDQIGNTMFAVGQFSQATQGGHTYTRSNFLAFNATNGAVSAIAPRFNGEVWTVAHDPCAPRYLYIGGDFTTVNGMAHPYLIKYDLQANAVVTSFKPNPDAKVEDIHFVGDKLIIAGTFSHIGAMARPAMASLDTISGDAGSYLNLQIAGRLPNTGPTHIYRFAVRPQQDYAVAIGNFTAVNGVSHQWAFMLKMGATHTELQSWDSPKLHGQCSANLPQPARDVAFGPRGAYFGMAFTGGAHAGTLCDAASYWAMRPANSSQQPDWINYTGGDTLHSIVLTSSIVYVGGHERWADNPPLLDTPCTRPDGTKSSAGYDCAGPTAVSRPGLGQLNLQGKATTWNPIRFPRGVGAKELYLTTGGLWVGSDATETGCSSPGGPNHDDCSGKPLESHSGIVFLPL